MINITFSKLVRMNGRLWEVNFRKLSRAPYIFHADTATLQGERIQFEMEREQLTGWHIIGSNLPAWITDNVENLGSAIELGMQEAYPQASERLHASSR